MHGMSARHVREEVLTGAAVESAGRASAVSGREGSHMNSGIEPGMGLGMPPAELVRAWEAVYGNYIAADRMPGASPVEMAGLSLAVASAWRDLAATPGLPWWLVASLTTSAEAFERQARADRSRVSSGRPTERGSGPGPLQQGEGGWYGSASGGLDRRG